MNLQKPINAGFRHKAGLGVGEVDGQFARRQIRLIKGQVDDRRPDLIGILFQTRCGLGLPSSRASIPPS